MTHGVHANMRLVYMTASMLVDGETLTVTGPPNGKIYPPGPGWLYLLEDGIPSRGFKVMVGDGHGPPVDKGALEKYGVSVNSFLRSSTNPLSHLLAC